MNWSLRGCLQTIFGTDNVIVTLSITLPMISHHKISQHYNTWSHGLFKHQGQLKSKSAVHTYPSDSCKCSPPPYVQHCQQGSLHAMFSHGLLLEACVVKLIVLTSWPPPLMSQWHYLHQKWFGDAPLHDHNTGRSYLGLINFLQTKHAHEHFDLIIHVDIKTSKFGTIVFTALIRNTIYMHVFIISAKLEVLVS